MPIKPTIDHVYCFHPNELVIYDFKKDVDFTLHYKDMKDVNQHYDCKVNEKLYVKDSRSKDVYEIIWLGKKWSVNLVKDK